jgi:hypothetical protein
VEFKGLKRRFLKNKFDFLVSLFLIKMDKDPNSALPIKNTACPCRKAKGLTHGWCGVAGGGVPACDH